MDASRRDLTFLFPLLAAAAAQGQRRVQSSNTWRFEDLPVRGKTRPVFQGATHTGFEIELHETELAPGDAPHPPHQHVHEEIMMVREGLMEVTISGKVSRLGPGSVAYVASQEHHGWKNVGSGRAHYFVLALRGAA